MNVRFTGRQAPLTPEIKKYCEKRLKRLEKLLKSAIDVDVILSVEKYRNKAEITVRTRGGTLVVTEETHEMMNSLNLAFDNLEKKVKKEKEKLREKKRRKARNSKEFMEIVEEQEGQKRVIRNQDCFLKPIPLEEAIFHFELEKKEIMAFRREGSEKWAVLYRRKDGNYGLIELD